MKKVLFLTALILSTSSFANPITEQDITDLLHSQLLTGNGLTQTGMKLFEKREEIESFFARKPELIMPELESEYQKAIAWLTQEQIKLEERLRKELKQQKESVPSSKPANPQQEQKHKAEIPKEPTQDKPSQSTALPANSSEQKKDKEKGESSFLEKFEQYTQRQVRCVINRELTEAGKFIQTNKEAIAKEITALIMPEKDQASKERGKELGKKFSEAVRQIQNLNDLLKEEKRKAEQQSSSSQLPNPDSKPSSSGSSAIANWIDNQNARDNLALLSAHRRQPQPAANPVNPAPQRRAPAAHQSPAPQPNRPQNIQQPQPQPRHPQRRNRIAHPARPNPENPAPQDKPETPGFFARYKWPLGLGIAALTGLGVLYWWLYSK